MAALLGLARRLPTVLRTVRWLRLEQARAQLHHALLGIPAPVRLRDGPLSLAVSDPITPFLGPSAHIRSAGGTQIEMLASRFDLADETDWDSREHGPLFAYHLHQQEYLRLASFEPRDRTRRMLDWVRRHPNGVGWDPHPISLRLLCWGKLLLTPGALEFDASERDRILASMADQAETLARGLEVRLQANHLLSNLISVVWAGILLDGTRSAHWRGLAPRLVGEIEAQIHPDGGHEERSPMYHSLLLESLLDLLNLCRAAPERAPEGLLDRLVAATTRMLSALEVWTHPDGRIALFADSGFDVAAEPAQLVGYAARLGVKAEGEPAPSRLLPQSGYVRLRKGGVSLLASIAGPAPAHQPGHAHCDALSFELALGRARFVSDSGLYEYLPGERRDRARATASHATVQIDGEEQAETWSAHRIGGRPVVELVGWNGEDRAEATCRGWSRPGTQHRRRFSIDSESVTIVDRVEGPCRELRITWPLAPGWRVELSPDGRLAQATREESGAEPGDEARGRAEPGSQAADGAETPSRVELQLAEGLDWRVEGAPFYSSFGCEVERSVLVGEGSGVSEAVTRIVVLD